MKRFYFLCTLMLAILGETACFAQDFSNKGKEFWLAYCYHVGMAQGGNPVMTLYITSDVNTAYKVEIYGVTTLQAGNIIAGQVVSVDIPTAYFINNEGSFTNKTIHVTSDKPVVVYSYITRSAISGATVCLPTNVLGKEYYAMSFTQVSNEPNSNSYFTIVAVEDNTSVEITPAANTKNGWTANNTYTVNLNKGQIYQVLGTVAGNNGVDLSGSKIKSVASAGGGCKRIAVFSGSGKISIGCATAGTSDNLYQQLYPVASWGKKYLSVPSYNRTNNYYRIAKSNVAANVFLNGILIPPGSFINNIYYQFSNNTPNKIESDLPISVTQYFTTQGCSGNGSPYDPDMIVLNPVEQNIDKVTLVSSNLVAGNPQHHLHIIMHNGGSGISSFKLDNNLIAPSSWVTHPQDAAYSYLYLNNVAQGYHSLSSDSGFNALAYGYADAESYGYSAGANVKDLYQFVSVQNQYATVNFPAACKNSPFYFSMTFPYQPTQIQWKFGPVLNTAGISDLTINSPVYDSTWSVNGKQLYKYKLTSTYSIATSGTYPITVLAQNPTSDGCGGEQEINYDLQVFDPPVADFSFLNNGCVTTGIQFTDNSNLGGRTAIRWNWNFADDNTGTVNNPNHAYISPGTYNVKYSLITDVGCLSDTASRVITLTDLPVAKFVVTLPNCVAKPNTFSDLSTITGGGVITRWYWDFGDGSAPVTSTSNADQIHTYLFPGTYNATLKVETSTGCQSLVFSKIVTINQIPAASFLFGTACLPNANLQFTNQSGSNDPSNPQLSYQWDFGDGNNSIVKDPSHIFTSTGPFNVSLTVTNFSGCTNTATKNVKINDELQAAFTGVAEICKGTATTFTDQSTAPGSTVAQWQWDFGDGTSSTLQNPVKTFTTAGIYTVRLNVTSALGCPTVNNFATRQITVNALPTADFNFSSPQCETRNFYFADASTANAGSLIKWTWNFGDGSNAVLNTGIPFNHVFAATGSYNVSLQTETDKGCISTMINKQVVINPVPQAGFISPEVCLTDPAAPFIDTSKIVTGNIAAWAWNFGDANANGANPNISVLQNPTHRYSTVGSYSASLVVTSNNGCKDTIVQIFTVNGSVPVAGFTVQNANACSNQVVSINDGSTVDFGSIVKLEIYWDNANDPTIKTTDDNPVPGKIYDHIYPEFGTPGTKSYSIKYVVYSGINCVNSFTRTVTVLATPTLAFSVVNPVCSNEPAFRLTQAQLINGLPGSGLFTGTGISSTGIFNPAQAGAGIHVLRYTYTSSNSCSNFIEQSVEVYPTPGVNAGPDKVVLEGGFVTLSPALNASMPVSYLWTPSTGLANPAIGGAIASPNDDITYTLTITSDKGCSANDQVFVQVLKAPVIPNIFSPNGDGVHDKWEIAFLESYPGCIIEIYNRYGQLIFREIGYSKPWDGTVNGKDVPIGTYYYIVDPKNGRKKMAGYVDLIR